MALCSLFPKKLSEVVGNGRGKSRKWKLWRSASASGSEIYSSQSEASDASPVVDPLGTAVAAVVRAPPRDFKVVKEEWAVLRIQAAFRGFLDGWCDSQGTVDQVKSKLQMRKEAAMKRERAIAYSISQQQQRSNSNHGTLISLNHLELDKVSSDSSWLERWMTAKSRENILMEQAPVDLSESYC